MHLNIICWTIKWLWNYMKFYISDLINKKSNSMIELIKFNLYKKLLKGASQHNLHSVLMDYIIL